MNADELAQAQAEYERIRPDYEGFADALRVLLTQLIREATIEIEGVTGRAKEVTSLLDKLRRKPEYQSLDDVVDKCGVRIVTRYSDDVPRVCELIETEFKVHDVVDHGVEDIQSFGYASRHLIVGLDGRRGKLREWRGFRALRAEIQVRSILQHAWASISHGLDYKTDADVPATVRRKLFRVAALLETGDELFNDFRADVEQLKSEYRDDVARNDWHKLTLDHDSLVAAWSQLPMEEIAAAAIANGWDGWHWGVDPPDNEAHRGSASRLIEIASAYEIETLGDLAHEMQQIVEDGERLRRVAEIAQQKGAAPHAIPVNVVSLMLLARNGRGASRRPAEIPTQRFRAALMDAVEAVAADPLGRADGEAGETAG